MTDRVTYHFPHTEVSLASSITPPAGGTVRLEGNYNEYVVTNVRFKLVKLNPPVNDLQYAMQADVYLARE